MKLRGLAPVAASLLLACGAGERERTASDGSPIINGQLDTTHQAVVAIFSKMAGCTGTVIKVFGGYAYVLTAAHCFNAGPINLVVRGNDYNNPDQVLQVIEYKVHPSYSMKDNTFDFAIVKATGAADSVPKILPLAPSEDTLKAGVAIEHVGYGLVSYPGGQTSQRHHAFGTISQMGLVQIAYDQPTSGPCSGDSGGPELVETPGGTRVAGVISYGDQECKVAGVSGRVSSVYKDFIVAYVGALDSGSSSSSSAASTGASTSSAATSGAGGSSGNGGSTTDTGAGAGSPTNWTAGDLNYQAHQGDVVSSKCSATPGARGEGGWVGLVLALGLALRLLRRREENVEQKMGMGTGK